MNIYPYVYRLDHPVTGEFYIGYRAKNKVPAEQDLGHKYFTSSNQVKPRFHEFTYQVIAEFFDHDAAYEFEQKLIFDLWGDANMLNKFHHYGKKAFNTAGQIPWNKGKNISDETKRKISEFQTGRAKSDETKAKMSETRLGRSHTIESKIKMSEAKKGRPGRKQSEETKKKISNYRKSRNGTKYKLCQEVV